MMGEEKGDFCYSSFSFFTVDKHRRTAAREKENQQKQQQPKLVRLFRGIYTHIYIQHTYKINYIHIDIYINNKKRRKNSAIH